MHMHTRYMVGVSNVTKQKYCSKCTEYKSLNQFGKNKSEPDGLYIWCKDCQASYQRAYTQRRREYARNSPYLAEYYNDIQRNNDFKKHYGITISEYKRLYKEQNGVCAICEQPETARNQHGLKRLAVDHNHTTGKARGLLCSSCNSKLGVVEDRQFVECAYEYLAKYETN